MLQITMNFTAAYLSTEVNEEFSFTAGLNFLTVAVASGVIFLSICFILTESILRYVNCTFIIQMSDDELSKKAAYSPSLALARISRKSHFYLLFGCLATCTSIGIVHYTADSSNIIENKILLTFQLLLFTAVIISFKYILFKYYRYKPKYKCQSCSMRNGFAFFCCYYGNLQLIKHHRDNKLVKSINNHLSHEMALGYSVDINKTRYARENTKIAKLLLFWNNNCTSFIQFRLKAGLLILLLLMSIIFWIIQETNNNNDDYFDDVVLFYYVLCLYITFVIEIVSLLALSYNYGTTPFAASLWLVTVGFYPLAGYLLYHIRDGDDETIQKYILVVGFLIVLTSVVVILFVIFNNNNLLFKTLNIKNLNFTILQITLAFYDACSTGLVLARYFTGDIDWFWGFTTISYLMIARRLAYHHLNPAVIPGMCVSTNMLSLICLLIQLHTHMSSDSIASYGVLPVLACVDHCCFMTSAMFC